MSNSPQTNQRKLPARITDEPLNAESLREVLAYKEIYDSEVERVVRVCDYWVKYVRG